LGIETWNPELVYVPPATIATSLISRSTPEPGVPTVPKIVALSENVPVNPVLQHKANQVAVPEFAAAVAIEHPPMMYEYRTLSVPKSWIPIVLNIPPDADIGNSMSGVDAVEDKVAKSGTAPP
jgi:hypothetical protein